MSNADEFFGDDIFKKAYDDAIDDYLEKIDHGDIDINTDAFKNYSHKLAKLEDIRRAEIECESKKYLELTFKKVLLTIGLVGLFFMVKKYYWV